MYDAWRHDQGQQGYGVIPPGDLGADTRYYMKRLEGAGLVGPIMQTGPPGAGVRYNKYELTPTLLRLVELLEAGRPDSHSRNGVAVS
jgi:hypothetical protein